MTVPNGYGRMAMVHMAEYLPRRFARIDDPGSYFEAVGEEVTREINDAMAAWDRAQPGLISEGQRNMARLSIEEMILGELVLLTPERDPDEPETDETGAWIGPSPGMGPWIPLWALTQEDLDTIDEDRHQETEGQLSRGQAEGR